MPRVSQGLSLRENGFGTEAHQEQAWRVVGQASPVVGEASKGGASASEDGLAREENYAREEVYAGREGFSRRGDQGSVTQVLSAHQKSTSRVVFALPDVCLLI